MTTDPDPFEESQRAARRNIPAEGNPYRDGSDEHSLWASALAELAQGPWQALQASETAFGRSVALRSRPAAMRLKAILTETIPAGLIESRRAPPSM